MGKPGKLRDQPSEAMVLCASNEDHTDVDFVVPPEGVPLGEKVTFEGYSGEPEAVLAPRKKQFEKLQPDLMSGADGIARFKDAPFMTTKGPCTARICNGKIK